MAEVRLEHVSKIYPGGVEAVKDVNIEIADKEFVVLVGPSGCGKSTTLRMIAGLETISRGKVYIDNDVVNDIPPKDRDIAMVFQNYALYPHMTVRENMAFGLKLRKISKDEIKRRVDEAAEILELTDLLDRKPKALSGGQRQRVALGRAIVRKPKVFLFDEPLSNLDAKLRSQMRVEIARLHQRLDATIIYVTHDQVEAMTMGTKIVVMKKGLVQQVDSPINLYNKPVNRFVAGFIGSPTMNFRTANVKDGKIYENGFEIALNDDQKKVIKDGQYTLGFRSENVHWDDNGTRTGKIKAKVEIDEPLGSETLLHLNPGDGNIMIAKVKPDTPYKVGDEYTFHIAPKRFRFFDEKSGEAFLR